MSKSDAAAPVDFDFWEFVACGRCHLPFSDSGGPPLVPFWVTECGHVVCNTHLKADQSCGKCGERDIQVAPLSRDMDRPMADWFTSAPQTFDTIAYAARFQFDQLASLVRHYKRKCTQQRMMMEKMKAEIQNQAALRSTVGGLQTENQRLRDYLAEPSELPNANGKRRMMDFGRNANSSPRTVITPIGPGRLTLPPSHQQPSFPHGQHHSDDGPQMQVDKQSMAVGYTPSKERPGSRRFAEQYSYNTPRDHEVQPIPAAPLSYQQAHPVRQALGRRQHAQYAHTSMPPPALPSHQTSKFKPSSYLPSAPARTPMLQSGAEDDNDMPPLPMPRLPQPGSSRQAQLKTNQIVRAQSSPRPPAPSVPSTPRRFAPTGPQGVSNQRFVPATPSGRRQQLMAPTPVTSGSSGSRMPFIMGENTRNSFE